MLSVECLPSLYWTKNGKNNTLKILFLVDGIGTNLKLELPELIALFFGF